MGTVIPFQTCNEQTLQPERKRAYEDADSLSELVDLLAARSAREDVSAEHLEECFRITLALELECATKIQAVYKPEWEYCDYSDSHLREVKESEPEFMLPFDPKDIIIECLSRAVVHAATSGRLWA